MRLLTLWFLVLAALAGCRKWKRDAPHVELDESQAILVKLEGYIVCLKEHSIPILELADLYSAPLASNAPAQTLPKVSATPDPKDCLAAITEARSLAPALPELVRAGDAFARALEQLHSITSNSAKLSAGKPPNPEAAAALHPELVEAFSAFERAQVALYDEVFRLNRQVHAAQLAQPAPQGKGAPTELEQVWNRMLYEAEGLVRFAVVPISAKQHGEFAAQLERYERALAATSLLVRAQGNADAPTALAPAQELLTAGRQLLHRVRDNIPYTDAEKIMIAANNEKNLVGSPASVLLGYNNLVAAPLP